MPSAKDLSHEAQAESALAAAIALSAIAAAIPGRAVLIGPVAVVGATRIGRVVAVVVVSVAVVAVAA